LARRTVKGKDRRTGTADLPLHGGKCPARLFARTRKMNREKLEAFRHLARRQQRR
jgi:hypothetical protein